MFQRLIKHIHGLSTEKHKDSDYESKRLLYEGVIKAKKEWDQACRAFEEASGTDEVDVAIYMLEAAERKYKIKLKEAKQANMSWGVFEYSEYSESS